MIYIYPSYDNFQNFTNFFRIMTTKSIVFKPATFNVSTLTIPMRDRRSSSLPNVSFSNGSKKFSLPFHSEYIHYIHSHYMNYIGLLKNGKKHGCGTIRYFMNKGQISNMYMGKYCGKWENDTSVDKGVFFNRKGDISAKGVFTNHDIFSTENIKYDYQGSFVNGKKEGFGTVTSILTGNIIYEGEWKNGLYHGFGKFYSKNSGRLVYEGQWMHSEKHGLGKLFYENGEVRYDGNWKKNMRDNFGKCYDKSGRLLYDGQWKKSKREGFGLLYGQDEQENPYLTYSGNFQNNKKHGKGTRFLPDGEICYEGLFADDRRDGKGIKFSKTGTREDVIYSKGMLHGPTTIYEDDGRTIKMKGKYIKNRFIDESIFSIRKFLESNDVSHLQKISKKDLSRYIQANFQISTTLSSSKGEMIKMLKKLHLKGKTEITTSESETKEDLFGNTIETPCRGNDGEIYDLKSMEYLFETNKDGKYVRIPYIYKSGNSIPNYPVMSSGVSLSSYTIMDQKEK